MAAGSIIIDLLMRTGSFETDTGRAEKKLKELQKAATATGKVLGAAIAGGAIAAAAAFDLLNKGAADFQDLAEETGAAAEDIASFAVAAGTAGVEMTSVSGAMIKLTKSLVGVDDESKAAGSAIAALGLDVEAFKKLDPAAQYEAVGKALGNFADGASKTAVALALFGRGGAEHLKVFKALEEQGGRQVILTQEQITLADAYADAQAKNAAQLKLYAQAVATEFLPAFNDLTGAATDFIAELVGISSATKGLGKGSEVREFADALVTAFGSVVDLVGLVIKGFEITGKSLGGIGAIAAQVAQGNFAAAKAISKDLDAEVSRIIARATFGEQLAARMAARNAAAANPASYSNEGRAPTQTRLQFDGAAGKQAAEKQSAADAYIKSLQDQLQKTEELTTVEKLLSDISLGRLKSATVDQLVAIEGLAHEIDVQKELTKQRKLDEDTVTAINKKVQENAEAAASLVRSVETPIERLNRELSELGVLSASNPFVDAETQARLASKAWDDYAKSVNKATEETSEFAKQAASNIQDALGSSVQSVLEGNFSDIEKTWKSLLYRLAAQAIAADIGSALFGKGYGKTTDNVGGLFGQLAGLFGGTPTASAGFESLPVGTPGTGTGRASGGPVTAGREYWVGEMGPERFRPATAGRIMPAGSDRESGGGVVIENHGARIEQKKNPTGGTRLVIDAAVAEVDSRIARGGSTAQVLGAKGVNLNGGLQRRG